MNLNTVAAGVVQSVNAYVAGTVQISTGYTTADDGSRTPSYVIKYGVKLQVQSLTYGDLRQLDGLNLNGDKVAIYVHGNIDGIVRPDNKGGDIITIPHGVNKGTWLVAMVLEQWKGWCKVAATRQLNPE